MKKIYLFAGVLAMGLVAACSSDDETELPAAPEFDYETYLIPPGIYVPDVMDHKRIPDGVERDTFVVSTHTFKMIYRGMLIPGFTVKMSQTYDIHKFNDRFVLCDEYDGVIKKVMYTKVSIKDDTYHHLMLQSVQNPEKSMNYEIREVK